jgi:hypothetical protein
MWRGISSMGQRVGWWFHCGVCDSFTRVFDLDFACFKRWGCSPVFSPIYSGFRLVEEAGKSVQRVVASVTTGASSLRKLRSLLLAVLIFPPTVPFLLIQMERLYLLLPSPIAGSINSPFLRYDQYRLRLKIELQIASLLYAA